MKQQSFFKSKRSFREHGGAHSVKKRRSRRPLSCKEPIHITLRSEHAHGVRALTRHRSLIDRVLKKASQRFHIRIYEKAICSNHLHLLVYGKNRISLQNFFRVVAGHIAQGIVKEFPIKTAGGAQAKCQDQAQGHHKNQRKFWALLLYSRVLTWGREYKIVKNYIVQNTLEALNIIAYRPRKSRQANTS